MMSMEHPTKLQKAQAIATRLMKYSYTHEEFEKAVEMILRVFFGE